MRRFVYAGVLFTLLLFLSSCNQQATLSVQVEGEGQVRVQPGDHLCDGSCTFNFPLNTQVRLQAIPAEHNFFAGWDGACSGYEPCELQLKNDTRVRTKFNHVKGLFRIELEEETIAVPLRSTGGLWVRLNPSEDFNVPPEALEVYLEGMLIGDGTDQVSYAFLPDKSTRERIFIALFAGERTWYGNDLVKLRVGLPGLYQTKDFLLEIVECGSCEN